MDFTKTMNDDDSQSRPADSFSQIWGRDSTRRRDDDTATYIEDEITFTPAPPQTQNEQKLNGAELFKGIENTAPKTFAGNDGEAYNSEHQIKVFNSQVASLEDQLDSKDADLKAAEKQLRASLINTGRMQKNSDEELKELNNQISELQTSLDSRAEQVETLQRQLDVAYKENSEEMYNAEVKLKAFREKIATIQDTLDRKEVEVERLKQLLDNADRENENKIGEERDESDIQLKDFRDQVSALQDALDEKETQAIQTQGKVDEAECENKILMEELDQLLKEKNEAESMAMTAAVGGDNLSNLKRIKELEGELEDASRVANLQLEELDEQVDELREKLKAERVEYGAKLQSRDTTIDELKAKLGRYEAVPNSTNHSYAESVVTEKSGQSFAEAAGTASIAASYGLTADTAETPAINTDDVTDIDNAKQKVYEARADATSVRESLEISTKRCAELTLANEGLVKKNSKLTDTTRERDELKGSVRDWTAQTYQWKRRAEDSEAKLSEIDGEDSKANINNDSDHQGMMIKAVMESRSGRGMVGENTEKKSGWSLFGRTLASNPNSAHNSGHFDNHSGSDGDPADESKDAQIEALEETIAKLRKEMFQMTTAHKEEIYLSKKRIGQLEGENEALTLQNGTLEQLSRFHES
jgi:chromosome segregation ATPase